MPPATSDIRQHRARNPSPEPRNSAQNGHMPRSYQFLDERNGMIMRPERRWWRSDTQSPPDPPKSRVPAASHLPKQCSSGLLGNLLLPLSASRFLPIAHLSPSQHSQSPATITHAQPLPRKPTAMKQASAGLVLSSFLIKPGEWRPWRMIRVE